ncbi:MAG: galactokinase [Planctomycetales bacterium]
MTAQQPTTGSSSAAHAAERQFSQLYGRPPRWIAVAPGRVNLIGEHTDYNDGYVLPMAIDYYTAIAGDLSDSHRIRASSGQVSESISVDATSFDLANQPKWAGYLIGTLALCADSGLHVGAIDLAIHSNVPTGSGLSSSAALEVATATLAETVSGQRLDPMAKARLCQQAEHQYAGVPCGIMDQAISVTAVAGHAMLLDCRSGEFRSVVMEDPGIAILIANTNVKHALNDGEYAVRRSQCEQAVQDLGATSLRDVAMSDLEKAQNKLDPVIFRRARHVVTEISRTSNAAELLPKREWASIGKLMLASHESLRDDYQVSCPELDIMVEIAMALGPSGGVFGSRMTGGGFGGCTVSVVATDNAAMIAQQLHTAYHERTGIEPTIFVTCPAQGAHTRST